MSLSKIEAAIVEATGNYLKHTKLGLKEEPVEGTTPKEHANGQQFRWTGIDQFFRLKLNESNCKHVDSICSAFSSAHSYMFVDNPRFVTSFEQNMSTAQRAVPINERKKAIEILSEVVKELGTPTEKDAGWSEHLDDLVDVTSRADTRRAKVSKPFSGGGPAPEGHRDMGKGVGNHPGGGLNEGLMDFARGLVGGGGLKPGTKVTTPEGPGQVRKVTGNLVEVLISRPGSPKVYTKTFPSDQVKPAV
jgi:hypothetical protein